MKVPINDLSRTYAHFRDEIDEVVHEVLSSGYWINGPFVKRFTEAFANYVGVAHAVGVGNGTDALEIAIRALIQRSNVPKNGGPLEVIMAPNAGAYSMTASILAGAVPVFADVEGESQLLDSSSVIGAVGENTVCVVATHLFGGFVDIRWLRNALDEAGYGHVGIIEDCAQAHGLKTPIGMAGSFGDISCFSFYPTKNLGAFGDGGAILTNDDETVELIRSLSQYGWSQKYKVDTPGGRNSRLDELQAAILSMLLPALDGFVEKRRSIMHAYKRALPSSITAIESPVANVVHLAVLAIDDRDHFREHLVRSGVSTDIHYPVLDADQIGLRGVPFRVAPSGIETAQEWNKKIITVPAFPFMQQVEIDHVCEALSSYKG